MPIPNTTHMDPETRERIAALTERIASLSLRVETHAKETNERHEQMIDVLQEMHHSQIDPQIHAEHHEAFKRWMALQTRREVFWDRVKVDSSKAAVISFAGAVLYTLWEGFRAVMRMKGGN